MSNPKFNVCFWYNGSVLSKTFPIGTSREEIEKSFRKFIQEKINDIFESSHWDICVEYSPNNDNCYSNKKFEQDKLEDAYRFLEDELARIK